MANYTYVAVDPQGKEARGTLDVSDQSEALRRIKDMGLFPTKVLAANERKRRAAAVRPQIPAVRRLTLTLPMVGRRVKPAALTGFTRQLATLVEAGMPLLRGLRILQEQSESRALKRVIGELAAAIESGNSFTEALAMHPNVFSPLYLNMVKAGEIGGALEVTLKRLAEFMEKARKIKGKVKAAMFYPCAVLFVAAAILTLLMVYIVPRFREIFEGLLGHATMPAFTMFVLNLSQAVKSHFLVGLLVVAMLGAVGLLGLRTKWGRWSFDHFKLAMPLLGPVFRKLAISRFSRTLGTLVNSGVPILQSLNIVKETAG